MVAPADQPRRVLLPSRPRPRRRRVHRPLPRARLALRQRAPQRTRAATALREAHKTARRLGAAPLQHEIQGLARRARIDLAEPLSAASRAEAKRPAESFGLTPGVSSGKSLARRTVHVMLDLG
jgi:hypothetical protein